MFKKSFILFCILLLVGCERRNYDVTPPTIKCRNDVIEINSEFDPNDYCTVRDDRSKTIKITMDGELNTRKEGRYSVTLTAVDEAGNMTVQQQSFIVGGENGVVFFRVDKDNNLNDTYNACVAEGKKHEKFECVPLQEGGKYTGYQLNY